MQRRRRIDGTTGADTNRLESGALRANLAPLFYDTLGWGAGRGPRRPLEVDGQTLLLTPLAELGGLPVFHAEMPPDGNSLVSPIAAPSIRRSLRPRRNTSLSTRPPTRSRRSSSRRVRSAAGKTELRTLPYTVGQPGRTTLERLEELAFSSTELGPYGDVPITQVMDKVDHAFSVRAVTDQFFQDYDRVFRQIIAKIQGVKGDKWLFGQRLMNRLMFLQFLARKGWMEFHGSTDYLLALGMAETRPRTFIKLTYCRSSLPD